MVPLIDRSWVRAALAVVDGEDEARRQYAEWVERAKDFKDAGVRVLRVGNPLGGSTYFICTNSPELGALVQWPTIEEIQQRCHPTEDADAIRTLERILRASRRPG